MRSTSPANANQEQMFEDLYRTHYSELCRYAQIQLNSISGQHIQISGRAEEVVQETFSLAWEKRSKLFSSPSPVGWLYKALHYKVMETIREDKAWAKRILRLSEYADVPSQGDFRLKAELLDSIPEEDYMLLKRLYLDGYTYRELSAQMGIKPSALAMRVKRAKERLRRDS